MADRYLRSTDGSDTDSGATWALAQATMVVACASAAAADTVYVSDNHSETAAATKTISLTNSTAANPIRVICGDDSAEPPTAVATTGKVATTGNTVIHLNGYGYFYGLEFEAGSGESGATQINIGSTAGLPHVLVLENCILDLNSTHTSPVINLGPPSQGSGDDSYIKLVNCTVKFNNVAQEIECQNAHIHIINLSIDGSGSVPTTLFTALQACAGTYLIEASDLSHSGGNITNLVGVGVGSPCRFIFRDCKLDASIAITTGTNPSPGGPVVELINCDSGDTNYRYAKVDYMGTVTHDTSVVRSGGASDGTTPISFKLASSANTKFWIPLVSPEIVIWNETVGSAITLTVHYVHSFSAALQNNDIWLETVHLGTSGAPLGVFDTDSRMANILSTPANQSANTGEDWDNGATAWASSTVYATGDVARSNTPNGRIFRITTGGTSGGSEPAAFGTAADGDSVVDNTATWRCMRREKLTATITPQEKGPIYVRVCLADPSRTVWVDPKILVT